MAITANTGGIQAFGPGGDDTSFLDESNGALPPPGCSPTWASPC
jgi:hypothetical protein